MVTVVLPAELGIDPTGIGQVLGLKEMGDTKVSLAKEAAEHAAADAGPPGMLARPGAGTMFDSTDVIVPPGQERGIMLVMGKDASVSYVWSADRSGVNHDTHADSPTVSYHGYSKGTGVQSDSGIIAAAFDGQHGWTWHNSGPDSVVVSLRIIGQYDEMKRRP